MHGRSAESVRDGFGNADGGVKGRHTFAARTQHAPRRLCDARER